MGVLVMMMAASDAGAAAVDAQLGCRRTSALAAEPNGDSAKSLAARFMHSADDLKTM